MIHYFVRWNFALDRLLPPFLFFWNLQGTPETEAAAEANVIVV